jgi:hypothetical protein
MTESSSGRQSTPDKPLSTETENAGRATHLDRDILTRAAELFERMAAELQELAGEVLRRTAGVQGEVFELFARQMTECRHRSTDVVHLLFVPREVCSWQSGPGVRGATELRAGEVNCRACRDYLVCAGLLPAHPFAPNAGKYDLPPLVHYVAEVEGRHYCGASPRVGDDVVIDQVALVTCRRCVERLEFFGLRAKSGSAGEQRQLEAIRSRRGARVRKAFSGEAPK